MGKAFLSSWFIILALMSFASAEEIVPFTEAEKRAIRAATSELVATSRLHGADARTLNDVIVFAKKAHGEMRRHGGEPAILHSLRVSKKVASSRHSSKTSIYAAVLHDVVEDTKVRIKPIRRAYGKAVADAVVALSLDPVEAFSNNKEARDKAYYERFSKASRAAHLVKLYDRMDNIRDMRGFSHEGKLGYLQSTRDKVIKALKVKSPDLARILEADVTRLEKAVRQSMVSESLERSLKSYRRGDGTLQWKRVAADKVLPHVGGVAHFALALFLKEMAVVVKTGDRGRIDEFFEGLATTDFFITYGLFSAGAHAGNVAYAKYLDKYIKPKFVSGILRTNLVLATGMALPEIYHGTFTGKSFAINLAGLGLSSSAVKAGVSSIRWVTRLRTSRAARLAARFSRVKRFSSIGGWVYTAAETAVVLYFGDEISRAINKYFDDKEAKNAVADATIAFFQSLNNSQLSPEEFQDALDQFNSAHSDYRNYLYKPLFLLESEYNRRLEKLAREAKQTSEKQALREKTLLSQPAIRARILRKYGTTENYLRSLELKNDRALQAKFEEISRWYNEGRAGLLRDLYIPQNPNKKYLDFSGKKWALAGGKQGSSTDPYRGRRDVFARWGRERILTDFRKSASKLSSKRLGTYHDQEVALNAALAQLNSDDPRRALIESSLNQLSTIAKKDAKLGQISSQGAVGALSGNR